jgi:hypothetical protein
MARDPELQRLVDEPNIRAFIHKYPRVLDHQDHALLATRFHPAAIDEHGHYNGSASGFVDWKTAGTQSGVHWIHHFGTKIIEFESDVVAHVETYRNEMVRRPDESC